MYIMIHLAPFTRFAALSSVLVSSAVLLVYLFILGSYGNYGDRQPSQLAPVDASSREHPPYYDRVQCVGARGKLLGDSPDDQLHSRVLDRRESKSLILRYIY